MIIFDAETEDDSVNRILAQGTQLIEAGQGRVAKTDRWGRRRFAYEINHKHEGYYVVWEFVGGSDLDQLERALRLADETVRHKIVRLPDNEAARRGLLEQTAS